MRLPRPLILVCWLGLATAPACPAALANSEAARVLRVGPAHELKTPGEAARVAQSGDTIEIDAGQYHNDYAIWRQDRLTIRGIGGMAELTSTRQIPNGKGIWITRGADIVIENISFAGAEVASTNGAGIRHEGGNLTLRNTHFHHNEFSVLSGKNHRADITISNSRFLFQRRATRHSHGIYIGEARRFTLEGSYIKGTSKGHQVKSRALENFILYNRIEDVPSGNSSRLVDLPNCGFSVIMGNQLHQGASTHNTQIIGYGAELCDSRTERQRQLFVMHNTLINDALTSTLVHNHSDGQSTVVNNLLFGRGAFLDGKGNADNNVRFKHSVPRLTRWQQPLPAGALDSAIDIAVPHAIVTPESEFSPPVGTRPRPVAGRPDIGAREATLAPGS